MRRGGKPWKMERILREESGVVRVWSKVRNHAAQGERKPRQKGEKGKGNGKEDLSLWGRRTGGGGRGRVKRVSFSAKKSLKV